MKNYPGGKNGPGVYQNIINQIPPHRVYIEAFLGYGAIMRKKRPAEKSIGIESDKITLDAWDSYAVPNLDLVHGDAIEWLKRNSPPPDAVVYLDPPYLMETRTNKNPLYRHEMSDDDHVRLLELIKTLSCYVLISGYYSDMYASALSDWRLITFKAQKRSGEIANEHLWLNYPEPLELHDYQYIGKDFRERDRIKKKRRRLSAKLASLPTLEAQALIATVDEFRESWQRQNRR
jgi:site-specific DNA-adenine methylase